MTKAQAAAYLAGMIDGEGHVSAVKTKTVSVANTEYDLIEAVVDCCLALDLKHRVNKPRQLPSGKQVWHVYITSKESLEKVRDVVPIRSRRKHAALVEAIDGFRYRPRPSREWVEEKYVTEQLSLKEVAQAWGLKNNCASCALVWLRYYGIPSRLAIPRSKPPPDETVLRRAYEGDRPVKEVAEAVGAHNLPMLYRWLRGYGIPLRTSS